MECENKIMNGWKVTGANSARERKRLNFVCASVTRKSVDLKFDLYKEHDAHDFPQYGDCFSAILSPTSVQ